MGRRGLELRLVASLILGLITELVASLILGLITELVASLILGLVAELVASLVLGLVLGLVAGLVLGLVTELIASLIPSLVADAWRGAGWRLLPGLDTFAILDLLLTLDCRAIRRGTHLSWAAGPLAHAAHPDAAYASAHSRTCACADSGTSTRTGAAATTRAASTASTATTATTATARNGDTDQQGANEGTDRFLPHRLLHCMLLPFKIRICHRPRPLPCPPLAAPPAGGRAGEATSRPAAAPARSMRRS